MPTNQSIKPTSIKLPPQLRNRMQTLAAARQRSVHELMIRAVETYVEREEKREAIRQECIQAHDDYLRTGLHLTDEEVDEWVDQVVQGIKADIPKCHV
jgi:predicted transcriptional regulator